jgi:hypothetical protein
LEKQIYYLIKDIDGDLNLAKEYAQTYLLPPSFILLIDGLWALDHGAFDQALDCLIDPSVIPDWGSKIREVFMSCGRVREALVFGRIGNASTTGEWSERDSRLKMEALLRKDFGAALFYQV